MTEIAQNQLHLLKQRKRKKTSKSVKVSRDNGFPFTVIFSISLSKHCIKLIKFAYHQLELLQIIVGAMPASKKGGSQVGFGITFGSFLRYTRGDREVFLPLQCGQERYGLHAPSRSDESYEP